MYEISTYTCPVNYWNDPVTLRKEVTAQHIINAACFAFCIDKVDLLSNSRKGFLPRARFILMYILKLKCSISLKKIGELLGGRDHTTVMHGIQVIKDDLTLTAYRYQTNEQIKSVIELL